MRKVFEIKVANSASFYSYLALSGIDFEAKEKPEVIIFTCDMTDAEFAAAVQYCNKLAEERKFNESVRKYKKLHEEYITLQKVKEILDDLFHDISRHAFYEQKEAGRELAEICVRTIKKTTPEFILTKKEIVDIVTKIGFDAMMNNNRLTEFLLPGWDEILYKIR
jgi:hypothetical protein|nr:MAG TPA: hypothetical protein [Caudoviricetes sp.]